MQSQRVNTSSVSAVPDRRDASLTAIPAISILAADPIAALEACLGTPADLPGREEWQKQCMRQ